MIGEHVFGDWLSKIGLSQDSVLHITGPVRRQQDLTGFFLRTADIRDLHADRPPIVPNLKACRREEAEEPNGGNRPRYHPIPKRFLHWTDDGKTCRQLVLRYRR